jgi:TolA-binding protein
VTEFPNGAQSRIAYYRLGTAAFAKGELEKAEAYYLKTIENNTDRELAIKAKYALAGCFEAEERLTDALKLYKEIEPEYSNPEAIRIKIKALETRIIKKSY